MNKFRISGLAFIIVVAAIIISSCGDKRSTGWEYARNMYDPIAYNPDQVNKNFRNGQTAQLPPAGTVPFGSDSTDEYANTPEGYLAASAGLKNPLAAIPVTLQEGKALYQSMCSHCHGPEGKGDGSIVKMGKFPEPPSFSSGTDTHDGGEMKDLTDGKIFHAITYGWNNMPSHRSQLSVAERWKIVMYVHELQKLQ